MRKISKIFSKDYYHRRYYSWLQRRKSTFWAWQLSKERYYDATGKKMSYKHPSDINQKLMWLNRYSNDPRRAEYADKYAVRKYVEQCGYGDTLVPLLGVWNSVDEIDFDALPNQFVLKCNHGSGYNIICTDKSCFDIEKAKTKLRKWMNECYDHCLQEKHYRGIPRKIICEQYLSQLSGGIVDYKFNCFDGKVDSCLVCYNRSLENAHGFVCFDHYDDRWNRTDYIKPEFRKTRRWIEKPSQYDKMKIMASLLSCGFEYVRVDLYEIDSKIYFGEMTFTPSGNIMTFYEDAMLKDLGDKLFLPFER